MDLEQHIIHQHGHIAHAPGHEAEVLAAEVPEFLPGFGEGDAPGHEIPVVDAGEGGDALVHPGVILGGDVQAQLVHQGEGIVQLHGTDLNDLAGEAQRIGDGGGDVGRLVPFQIEDDVIHSDSLQGIFLIL